MAFWVDTVTTKERLRAAIYCRVSTQEQSERGYSLEAQAQDCRKLAGDLGAEVVATFQDIESGAEWELPGLNALLDGAKRHDFELVLCLDPDRLARRMAKQLIVEEELTRSGVSLRYMTLKVDDTAEGRLLKNVKASISEYEREKIAFRTSRGRRAKAERGLIVGTGVAPYGYRYVYTEGPDRRLRVTGLEPDHTTAPVVERIFRDLATMSASAVCDRLNGEGVPTYLKPGARWATSTILGIVENPVYVGTAAYGRRDTNKRKRDESHWLTISVPALVDASTWEAVRHGLTRRKSERSAANNETEAAYPLRGMLTCGHCGGTLACIPNRAGYRYYVCLRTQPGRAKSQGKDLCTVPPVPVSAMNVYAWGLVSSTLLDPKHMATGLAQAQQENQRGAQKRQERADALDKEIGRLRTRLDRITAERMDSERGSERERALLSVAAEAEANVAHLLAEKAQLDAEPQTGLSVEDAQALGILARDFAREVEAGLEQATTLQQRQVYKLLRLQCRVRYDAEAGVPLGRRHRFSLDWQAVIELRNGTKEYKKTRVRYFTEELDAWEREYLCKPPVSA